MKIGILGGTFNPVHLGHIALARESYKKLKLDKLIFIPAYIPPHKNSKQIISWKDRYRMLELAIEEHKAFEISDIEIKRKGKSYSIDTIKEVRKAYAGAEVLFITGSDSIEELKDWKDIEGLKGLCTFIIAARPGYKMDSIPANTEALSADTLDVSSTKIRELVKQGADFRAFVPEKVYEYIGMRKLYL